MPPTSALNLLVLTSISTAVTSVFPAFVSWRFYRNEQDLPATKQEKYTQYILIACLTFFHFAEAAKAAYFGLLYSNATHLLSLIPRIALLSVINIATEIAHILLISVVMMRMSGLMENRRKSFISHDQPSRDPYTVAGYAIAISRGILPLLSLAMKGKVSTFGAYMILILILEILVFSYATFVISRFLSRVQRDDDLQIPGWRLFSNPLVTGALTGISFLSLVVMVATYSYTYEALFHEIDSQGPIIMPSVYGMLVGLTLILYQDTYILIQEARTPNGSFKINAASKKKFTTQDIFQQ